MTEMKSYLTQELIELKEQYEEYTEDMMWDGSHMDGTVLPHAYELYGSDKLRDMIHKAADIPAGSFVISYLLSAYKQRLESFVLNTFEINRRDSKWVKRVLDKSKDSEALLEELAQLVMDEFKANGCTDGRYASEDPEKAKVYASYSHNAENQAVWSRTQIRNILLQSTRLTEMQALMFAMGIGMSAEYVDLLLRKVLKRGGLNIRKPEEAMLRIAFEQVDPDKRLAFYRAAMKEYDACAPEAPELEEAVEGSTDLLNFSDQVMEMFNGSSYESVMIRSGELSAEAKKFIRNYKFLLGGLVSERRAVQHTRERAEILVDNINELNPAREREITDTYLRKTVVFAVEQDSEGIPAGTRIKAVPCDVNGNPVAADSLFFAELLDTAAPKQKTAGKLVDVTVLLKLDDELKYKMAKGKKDKSSFCWNGYSFWNNGVLDASAEKGAEIEVCGELPAGAVIPAGAVFEYTDKKNNIRKFVCSEEVCALPEWETAVKFVSSDPADVKKPGAVDKHTVFTLVGYTGSQIHIINHSGFKSDKKGGNVFVKCSASEYVRNFYKGAVLECVRDGAVFRYEVTKTAAVDVKDSAAALRRVKAILSEQKKHSAAAEYIDYKQTVPVMNAAGTVEYVRFTDKKIEWHFEVPEQFKGVAVENPKASFAKAEEEVKTAEKTAEVKVSAGAPYVPANTEFAVEFRTVDGLPLKADTSYTARNRKGFVESDVVIPLVRKTDASLMVDPERKQTVLVKKNRSNAYTWNGYHFSNKAEVSVERQDDECIEAAASLPVNTVVPEGEEFVFYTDTEQKPVVFTAAKTVTAYPEFRTTVRFTAADDKEYEKNTVFALKGSDAVIRNHKKIRISSAECELFVKCSAQEYLDTFGNGAELVLTCGKKSYGCEVLKAAEPESVSEAVKFTIFEQGEGRILSCTNLSKAYFKDAEGETIMKYIGDMACSYDSAENKVVLTVKGITGSEDKQTSNANHVYRYLYEDFSDLADGTEVNLKEFDQDTLKRLSEIVKDNRLTKNALYALLDPKRTIAQGSRTDLITITFLNTAINLQECRFDGESDSKYSDSTMDTQDEFLDDVDEVLREAGYYELYPGDPYESLLTWILACHEPLELYRRICKAVAEAEGEADDESADE